MPMFQPHSPNNEWWTRDGCEAPTSHTGAVFTVELGTLVDSGFDIGLKAYPIFDANYREPLNAKIVEHFWFREIGFETPQMFKRFLNRRMNEIMPYYNELYKTTLYDFDPLVNYDLKSTGSSRANANQDSTSDRIENAVTDSSSTTNSETLGYGRTLVNSTPQMQLSGYDDYATNVTDTESDSIVQGSGTQKGTSNVDASTATASQTASTDSYVSNVVGITGITKSSAVQQFRETLLNVDMLVIGELEDLFMGILTDYWNGL